MQEFRQQHGRAGERYWQIGYEDKETIFTAWGAMKEEKHREHGHTKDRPGPKGKKGTKAWFSAEANAAEVLARLIRKKEEEGYVELGMDGRPLLGESAGNINFALPLPKNLCFSKPLNSVKEERIKKMAAAGELIYTKKVNGMMVIVQVQSDGAVLLYTRRMDSLTEHFPHLVQAIKDLQIPPKTIMLFEAFLGEGKTQDEFDAVGSVMRSKAPRAIKLQEDRGWMKFYLFRAPVCEGIYGEMRNTCEVQVCAIEEVFADMFIQYRSTQYPSAGRFLHILEVFEGKYKDAREYAKEEGYEGWVCYKRKASIADYSFSFHGKPDRPSCCFKLKNDLEDDFICIFNPNEATKELPMGTWGTGKNMGKVGTMSLYQVDGSGTNVYICEVGTGLTDEQRGELIDTQLYPLIAEIRFQARKYLSKGGKSNALTHPRVIHFRDDKTPEECVNKLL